MLIKTNFFYKLTFGFATGIALFPFIFVRKNVFVSDILLNHEKIHIHQQIEMLILPFYIWYIIEYFLRLFKYKNHYLAYRNISFEREAYVQEKNIKYLKNRSFWAFMAHL